jgi:hypothetical protein
MIEEVGMIIVGEEEEEGEGTLEMIEEEVEIALMETQSTVHH